MIYLIDSSVNTILPQHLGVNEITTSVQEKQKGGTLASLRFELVFLELKAEFVVFLAAATAAAASSTVSAARAAANRAAVFLSLTASTAGAEELAQQSEGVGSAFDTVATAAEGVSTTE